MMRLTSSNKQPSRKKKENAYKTTFVYQMSLVVVGGGRGGGVTSCTCRSKGIDGPRRGPERPAIMQNEEA